MSQRVVYGFLAIVVVFTLVVLDVMVAEFLPVGGKLGNLLQRGSIIPIVAAVVALLGAIELNRLFGLTGRRVRGAFAHCMVVVLVLSPWLAAAGWLGERAVQLEGLLWQSVWLLMALVGSAAVVVAQGDPTGTVRNVGSMWIMVLYLGFLNSFAVQLRCSHEIRGSDGAWLLLSSILVIKAADIGAYFVGSAVGRRKLMPAVSPSKTVEGMVGGLLGSAAAAMGIAWVGASCHMPVVLDTGFEVAAPGFEARLLGGVAVIAGPFGRLAAGSDGLTLLPPLIFGLSVSAAGQIGDLFESCFKREAGVKDSGNVIPRFGGILDLIDSPALAIPVAWFLLTVVWNVG
ncbi:MAG TPA: phosphatidate cytidylyltransferase [Phycisphaerae bacterium]|nr:phosphatidate cytidylyltransferase [Phycisphaerae bacterium]HNU46132.1 phosphatidate cytidylyltransferase [Phycisphaerae bacterium]